MNQQLTKAERVRRRVDYLRIQNSGRKHHTSNFICFGVTDRDGQAQASTPANANEPRRLGITVSRRVGRAVVRNRVKRLVREAFRRHKQEFPPGLELVVIARAEAAELGYAEVERQLCEVSRRLGSPSVRPRPQ